MVNFSTYSTTKGEYFYLNQKVRDLQTNDIGYIYNLSKEHSFAKSENIIKVQYNKYKKIYLLHYHVNLVKVNLE